MFLCLNPLNKAIDRKKTFFLFRDYGFDIKNWLTNQKPCKLEPWQCPWHDSIRLTILLMPNYLLVLFFQECFLDHGWKYTVVYHLQLPGLHVRNNPDKTLCSQTWISSFCLLFLLSLSELYYLLFQYNNVLKRMPLQSYVYNYNFVFPIDQENKVHLKCALA